MRLQREIRKVSRRGRSSSSVAIALAVLVGVAGPGCASSAGSSEPGAHLEAAPDLSSLHRQIDDFLVATYPADAPGAVVLVTLKGEPFYIGARGMADVQAGEKMETDSIFLLASITKQMVATTTLQLVAEGKLSLDDPLSRFFPDYPQPAASVTVRQLLNHTSGLQDYVRVRGWMVPDNITRSWTTHEMVAITRDLAPVAPAGTVQRYNNSGFIHLGAVIEAVTGQPWHQAVEERIIKPLGLSSTGYGEGFRSHPRMVQGYQGGPEGPRPALPIHMSVPHAAGGLAGSVEDLARFAHALHHGRLIPPALYAEMLRPTVLPDGTVKTYGFGTDIREVGGELGVGHSGDIFGFGTASLYLPSHDLFVAVFTNTEAPPIGSELAVDNLIRMVLVHPALPKAQPDGR